MGCILPPKHLLNRAPRVAESRWVCSECGTSNPNSRTNCARCEPGLSEPAVAISSPPAASRPATTVASPSSGAGAVAAKPAMAASPPSMQRVPSLPKASTFATQDDVRGRVKVDLRLHLARLVKKGWWSSAFAATVGDEYLRFMYMHALHPNAELVPSTLVDKVWHAHILDTPKYHEDCQRVFGHVMHHLPNYDDMPATGPAASAGESGDAKADKGAAACAATIQLYEKIFGHKPPQMVWESLYPASARGGEAEGSGEVKREVKSAQPDKGDGKGAGAGAGGPGGPVDSGPRELSESEKRLADLQRRLEEAERGKHEAEMQRKIDEAMAKALQAEEERKRKAAQEEQRRKAAEEERRRAEELRNACAVYPCVAYPEPITPCAIHMPQVRPEAR